MFSLKKAAMFGLDARIALAIFGALSVISGAALYNAVQQTKVTVNIHNINEIVKAMEAYMLDTGSHLQVEGPNTLEPRSLFENYHNLPGWKGPYLSDTEYGIVTISATKHYVGYKTKSGEISIALIAARGDQGYCQKGANDCNIMFKIYCNSDSAVKICNNELMNLLEEEGYSSVDAHSGYILTKEKMLPYYPLY
jgi:type II secretory pathway pseudopilin PulG